MSVKNEEMNGCIFARNDEDGYNLSAYFHANMSKICQLCAKGPTAGNNVSHSNRHTRRRFLPNLVTKRFGSTKIKLCTQCLRTLKRVMRIEAEVVTAETAPSAS